MSPSELSRTPQQVGLVAGFVVIGRNEGARLDRALRSIPPGAPVVYVDSGSTDSSVTVARALKADVVELDLTIPFTAARARNAGASRLMAIRPDLGWAMFMDGDCELIDGWIDGARVRNEILLSIRRAGADLIITYHAMAFAEEYNGK